MFYKLHYKWKMIFDILCINRKTWNDTMSSAHYKLVAVRLYDKKQLKINQLWTLQHYMTWSYIEWMDFTTGRQYTISDKYVKKIADVNSSIHFLAIRNQVWGNFTLSQHITELMFHVTALKLKLLMMSVYHSFKLHYFFQHHFCLIVNYVNI